MCLAVKQWGWSLIQVLLSILIVITISSISEAGRYSNGADVPRSFPMVCTHYVTANGLTSGNCDSVANACEPNFYFSNLGAANCGSVACLLPGTYQGANNMLDIDDAQGLRCTETNRFVVRGLGYDPRALPPVIFDGQGVRAPIVIAGIEYFTLHGVMAKNSSTHVISVGGPINQTGSSHVLLSHVYGMHGVRTGNAHVFLFRGDPDGADFPGFHFMCDTCAGAGDGRKTFEFYGMWDTQTKDAWGRWEAFDTTGGPKMVFSGYNGQRVIHDSCVGRLDATIASTDEQVGFWTMGPGDDVDTNINNLDTHFFEISGCLGWADETDGKAGWSNFNRFRRTVGRDSTDIFVHHSASILNGGWTDGSQRSWDNLCSGQTCTWIFQNVTGIGGLPNWAPAATIARTDEHDNTVIEMSDPAVQDIYQGPQCEAQESGIGACLCWQSYNGEIQIGEPRWPQINSEAIRLALANAGLEAEDPNAEIQENTTKTGTWPSICTRTRYQRGW